MIAKINKEGFQSRNDLNYLLTELKESEPWLYLYHSKMLQMVSTQIDGAQKGFDIILSNPIKTKAIASAKIKTDKIDAKILADLLKGGYVAQCYIPDRRTMDLRELVRHRDSL